MTNTSFNVTHTDWRDQLRHNQRRTRWVIGLFLAIYVAIGMLIDVVIQSSLHHQVPLVVIVTALATFKLFPYATLSMGIIALIALWITFSFYDRIMLLGTEYHEVTPETARDLAEKQLYNVVEEMKVASGLQYMPKVYLIEADYMNAFASGYSEKSAMVAITRGLMTKLDRSELTAVMAHELSHIRHQDIKLTLTASVLTNIMLIAVDFLFYSFIFSGSGDEDRRRDNNALLIVIIVLRYVLPLITVLLTLYLSRTREFMADSGCVELMRDNQPLARALVKIDQDHQANQEVYQQEYAQTAHEDVRRAAYLYDPVKSGISPGQSLSSMFSTHPSIPARLKAIGIQTTRS